MFLFPWFSQFQWVNKDKSIMRRSAWLALFFCMNARKRRKIHVNEWNDFHAWCLKDINFLREFIKTNFFLRYFMIIMRYCMKPPFFLSMHDFVIAWLGAPFGSEGGLYESVSHPIDRFWKSIYQFRYDIFIYYSLKVFKELIIYPCKMCTHFFCFTLLIFDHSWYKPIKLMGVPGG